MAVPAYDPRRIYQQLIQPTAAAPMPAAPAFSPMSYVVPDLGPEEIAYFDSLQSRLNNQYGQGAAQNLFQQSMLQSEQGVREQDLGRRFDQMREKLPAGFQQRGLMNSGVYQQGLTDYGTERTNAFADLQRGFQNQMGGLQQAYAQMGSTYSTGMSDVESQRTARRRGKAAALRSVM